VSAVDVPADLEYDTVNSLYVYTELLFSGVSSATSTVTSGLRLNFLELLVVTALDLSFVVSRFVKPSATDEATEAEDVVTGVVELLSLADFVVDNDDSCNPFSVVVSSAAELVDTLEVAEAEKREVGSVVNEVTADDAISTVFVLVLFIFSVDFVTVSVDRLVVLLFLKILALSVKSAGDESRDVPSRCLDTSSVKRDVNCATDVAFSVVG